MLVKSIIDQDLSDEELEKLYVYSCITSKTECMVELSKHVNKEIAEFALYASSEQCVSESVKFNKKLIESFDK